jgi:hypothetical protein
MIPRKGRVPHPIEASHSRPHRAIAGAVDLPKGAVPHCAVRNGYVFPRLPSNLSFASKPLPEFMVCFLLHASP